MWTVIDLSKTVNFTFLNSRQNKIMAFKNGTKKNDTLTGTASNDTLNGLEGADKLNGGNGNDVLNGGIDNDIMVGGNGDDYYFVDNLKDVVTETNTDVKTGGNDTIETSLSTYTLPVNVENLIFNTSKAVKGIGNQWRCLYGR